MPRPSARNAAAADLRKYRLLEALNRAFVFMTCPSPTAGGDSRNAPDQHMTSLQRVIISRPSLRGRDATLLRFGVSSPTPSHEQTRCQTIASASREEPVARRQPRSSSSADTPNVTKGYLPGEWHSPFWQTKIRGRLAGSPSGRTALTVGASTTESRGTY